MLGFRLGDEIHGVGGISFNWVVSFWIINDESHFRSNNLTTSEENSGISEDCVISNVDAINTTKVLKALRLKSNSKNNLSQLSKNILNLELSKGYALNLDKWSNLIIISFQLEKQLQTSSSGRKRRPHSRWVCGG